MATVSLHKRYDYYVVEEAYPARVSTDPSVFGGEYLARDGTWHADNALKICEDGRMVDEHEALTFWNRHCCSVSESSDLLSTNTARESTAEGRVAQAERAPTGDRTPETTGVEARYLPGARFAVKPRASLEKKIRRLTSMGHTDAVQIITDALRGSIIVDRPEQVAPAAAELRKEIEARGGQIVFDNKFEYINKFSYGAVHGNAFIQTPQGGWIRAEVQIHLRAVHRVKETAHQLYENAQSGRITESKAVRNIQRLYLEAMREVLKH